MSLTFLQKTYRRTPPNRTNRFFTTKNRKIHAFNSTEFSVTTTFQIRWNRSMDTQPPMSPSSTTHRVATPISLTIPDLLPPFPHFQPFYTTCLIIVHVHPSRGATTCEQSANPYKLRKGAAIHPIFTSPCCNTRKTHLKSSRQPDTKHNLTARKRWF